MKPTRESIFRVQTSIQKAREEALALYSDMTEEEKEEMGGEIRSKLLDCSHLMQESSTHLQDVCDHPMMHR